MNTRTTDLMLKLWNCTPASIARHLGSTTAAARMARPILNCLMPDGIREISVRSGLAAGLKLPIDLQQEKFYWTGTHDSHVQRAIYDNLTAGMTFWDIGAHIGFMSIIASRAVGPFGHVHAFEPFSGNFARLTNTIELNHVRNVVPHNLAIGDRRGSAELFIGDTTGTNSLANKHAGKGSILVACETIDALSEQLGVPDLIKIDVEGAEVEVLLGGRQTFLRSKPTIIVEANAIDRCRAVLPGYEFKLLANIDWLCTLP